MAAEQFADEVDEAVLVLFAEAFQWRGIRVIGLLVQTAAFEEIGEDDEFLSIPRGFVLVLDVIVRQAAHAALDPGVVIRFFRGEAECGDGFGDALERVEVKERPKRFVFGEGGFGKPRLA